MNVCVPFGSSSTVHLRSSSWPSPDGSRPPFPDPLTTWDLIPTQRRVV